MKKVTEGYFFTQYGLDDQGQIDVVEYSTKKGKSVFKEKESGRFISIKEAHVYEMTWMATSNMDFAVDGGII